jgi:predicted DNA-binding protein YlxM (UPF0122 family)
MDKKKIPTPKQIAAFKYVHILDCSHEHTADVLGCSRQAITRRLDRLKATCPEIFPDDEKAVIVSWDVSMERSGTIVKVF